ncbi:hypothetical protein PFISCL1PPCAC_18919 [Pristionchus fissidentatus]|uniref:RNA polymerase II subunit A C-terminal domain phosphatase n=1 Tax=Pristionchus fissidentatus TaxID=1538716 RepID=A0AAV5W716_9BILA|nr:hypothetical protein PFISCL1PPCAC_18919 [Pristionchus fissidentatus]
MTDVLFTSEDGCVSGVIVQRKCTDGGYILKDAVIIEFRPDGADAKSVPLKLRSPTEGVVRFKPGTKRGDKIAAGSIVCCLADCDHHIVMKDMCATCGKNLREKDGQAGVRGRTVDSAARVPMIHNVPELVVSDELAREVGDEDRQHCLSARKLVLLVDLDQTVIHSTNRQPKFDPKEHPDITQFTLYGGVHWTKLRPGTIQFFKSLSTLYEMHIVTFGQRAYADQIAQIIDPDKTLFSHRILSRDEAFSQTRKTDNLAALFPSGEEMVAIIDDRPDVWEYSDALVQLRPYKYFPDVDDINAPPNALDRNTEKPEKEKEDAAEEGAESSSARQKKEEESKENERRLPSENDEALKHVETVLRKVHAAFYRHYDETGKIRDLKIVISCLRAKTLKGCVIVLSGLVPVGMKQERSDAYRIAVKFGAEVVDRVDEKTTHVVAARWGTSKVHDARRLGVFVVSPDWLYACLELWEKAEEAPFVLTPESANPIGAPLGSNVVPDLANIPTMGKDLLTDMAHEVDEALSDEDEEEKDGEDDDDDDDEDFDDNLGAEPAWRKAAVTVTAPHIARPKIDESRVKRRLCPEALDRGYTGESNDEDDDDSDAFGGSSRKKSRRMSRGERYEEEREERREEVQEEEEEEGREADYGEDLDEDNEDEDDDEEMNDMAALLEQQLEQH